MAEDSWAQPHKNAEIVLDVNQCEVAAVSALPFIKKTCTRLEGSLGSNPTTEAENPTCKK